MLLALDLDGTVLTGSMLLAIPIAALAGLVSFFSPCVLPLVPGYLSYVTGVTGADLAEARRGRILVGTLLFLAGFTGVFVSFGAAFGYAGNTLLEHQDLLIRVLGALTIVMGLAFMGVIPWLTRREFRIHTRPAAGLVGAPMLGVLFGLGWTPCIGPTLAAVQTLAFVEGGAGRGMFLSLIYCVGLGLPFVLASLLYRRALNAFGWLKRHTRTVTVVGGVMLVLVGLAMVSGLWTEMTIAMQGWAADFQTVI